MSFIKNEEIINKAVYNFILSAKQKIATKEVELAQSNVKIDNLKNIIQTKEKKLEELKKKFEYSSTVLNYSIVNDKNKISQLEDVITQVEESIKEVKKDLNESTLCRNFIYFYN